MAAYGDFGSPRKCVTTVSLLASVFACIFVVCAARDDRVNPPESLLCVNDDCTGVISFATTTTKYLSQARFLLSFKSNTKVRVLAKPKNANEDYWGIEMDGLYGFVPRQFLRENSVMTHPKTEVHIDDFIKAIKKFNREHRDRYKKELAKSQKKENDDTEDAYEEGEEEEEEKNNQDHKDLPDLLNKKDEFNVNLNSKRDDDRFTENLVLNSTAKESIISSAPPESNFKPEDIQATQSVTVIDGTTIYDAVQDFNESLPKLEPNEQTTSNLKTDNIESATIISDTIEDSIKNVDNLSLKESIDESIPKPALYSAEISQEKSSDKNTEMKIQDDSSIENLEIEVKDTIIDSNYLKSDEEFGKKQVNELPNENIDNIAIYKNDNNELKPELSVDESKSPEISSEVDETSSEVKSDFKIENTNIESNSSDESLENILDDITNPANNLSHNISENIVNTENETEEKFVDEFLNMDNNNVENKTETFSNNLNINIGSNEVLQNNFEQTISENIIDFEKSVPLSDINNFDNLSAVDSQNVKENISNLPFDNILETAEIASIENSEGTEESFTDTPFISETPSSYTEPYMDENFKIDQLPPEDVLIETTTPTIETLNSNTPEDIFTSYPNSEKSIFDFGENLNDQQNDKLSSNIDNEESFFTSPLILLNRVYSSISNVFKSSDISNTMDKANTNVFNSEEMKSKQFEDTDSSNNYMSMFTESSQCNIEEKNLPSIFDISTDLIFWLVISAVSVLMFTLGYYYLENRKQDGKLLAMVNSLQKQLLCSSKECIILKEELSVTKEKLMGIEDSSFGTDEMVSCLKKELAEYQQTITDLQEKLTSTEEELANSTEAALELQSILDEQLSAKDTSSSSLTFTVTNLQSQLDDQQTTMNLTKAQLAAKVEENELLSLKLLDADDKCASLEKQLHNIQESLKQSMEDNQNKSQQIQELSTNLEKSLLQAEMQKNSEIENLHSQIKGVTDELNTVKASFKASSREVQSLQDNIKLLQTDEKNINTILDYSHIQAELVKITSEKNSLTEKYEIECATIKDLHMKIDAQNSQLIEMKEKYNEANQKTLESTTRLEVLTNYFNQKESELLKEINTKESLWMSKQGEAMSTVEKIKTLQQEIQQQKETTESVRREIVEQEAAWRAKVTALEQRSHDHWLARRAAERAAEASAREAQTLRQRLSLPSPDKNRVVSPLAGEPLPDSAYMPPLGMLPPPPLGFLPPPLGGPMIMPPPLPPLPPHRPPPLGRLSSPPPLPPMRRDRSFSPDSRYSPDRSYSPQHRGRSPFSNSESRRRNYNNKRYDDRYYDSEEDRRSRRYETETDFSPVNTLPPSPVPNSRNHKGVSSGSGQSYDSLEKFK